MAPMLLLSPLATATRAAILALGTIQPWHTFAAVLFGGCAFALVENPQKTLQDVH